MTKFAFNAEDSAGSAAMTLRKLQTRGTRTYSFQSNRSEKEIKKQTIDSVVNKIHQKMSIDKLRAMYAVNVQAIATIVEFLIAIGVVSVSAMRISST